MTFRTRVVTHTTRPGLPHLFVGSLLNFVVKLQNMRTLPMSMIFFDTHLPINSRVYFMMTIDLILVKVANKLKIIIDKFIIRR